MMHIPIEAQVECTDGRCGKSVAVTVDPVRRQVTQVIVDDKTAQRLVPMDQVEATASDSIRLCCTKAQLAEMPSFVMERFVPVAPGLGKEAYRYYALPLVTGLEPAPPVLIADEQVPSGELAVHRGMPVEASDGHVGKVGELVVDPQSGEITHFVLQEGHLWGKKRGYFAPLGYRHCLWRRRLLESRQGCHRTTAGHSREAASLVCRAGTGTGRQGL